VRKGSPAHDECLISLRSSVIVLCLIELGRALQAERKLAALPVEDTVQCTAYINLTAAAAKALISLLGLAGEGLL